MEVQRNRRKFTDAEKKSAVADYLFSKERMEIVAERHNCSTSALSNWIRHSGFQARKRNHWMKNNLHLWCGGVRHSTHGYIHVHIRRPDVEEEFHVMASRTGYILLHRLVMARYLGRPLLPTEQVHHKDGNRSNNSIQNLQLRILNHGNGVVFCCADCGSKNIVPGVI